MFPLYSKSFPATAEELEALLNQSIDRAFSGVPNAVRVREKEYPKLKEIRIELSGAELRSNPPRPPLVKGHGSPALQMEQLHISGSSLTIGPAVADLSLQAEKVQLNEAADQKGERVLLIQNAANGTIEITTSKASLERAIAAVAKEEAGKQGVSIDQVQLSVQQRGERSIDAEVQLRGRKLFFSTVIRIAASLNIDEDLNATVSGLKCNGDGAVGALACGVLAPHLEKLDGRTFALMGLPLGEIRLRDVRISAGDKLSVSAAFGA